MKSIGDTIRVLLVEDNLADIRLTQEALKGTKVLVELDVVRDGEEAMRFLRKQGQYRDAVDPDVVLLDLNLPRKDGREVLAEIKADEELKRIPVVILTSSQAEEDILRTYELHANCFITKPVDFAQFLQVVRCIEEFWFTVVKLPPKE
jgi:chemotaxis family two-component system response regulator Rcp1